MFLFFFRIKTAAEQQGKQGLKRTSVQSLHNFVNFGYSNFFKMSIWYGRFSLPFHFEVAISGSNGRFSNLGFRDFFMSKFSVWNQHSFLPFQWQYFHAKESLNQRLLNLTTEIATLKRNGREKRPYQNVFKSRKIKEQNFLLQNNQFWHKKVTHSQVAKSSDTGTEDKSVHLTSSPSEAGKI